MLRFIRFFLVVGCLSALVSACKDEIHIANFDNQKWKDDPNGCTGARQEMLTLLLAEQSKLIGHNMLEVKEFLGKPDGNDLRTRGQKFFEYGIKGGNLCNQASSQAPEILRIRFDALDRVTEVAMY